MSLQSEELVIQSLLHSNGYVNLYRYVVGDGQPESLDGTSSSCGFSPREKDLSRVMRSFWRNFASTGDPNLAVFLADGDDDAGANATARMPTVPEWPRWGAVQVEYR
jgi:hypothetical protein